MIGIIAAMTEEMEAIRKYMLDIKTEKEFGNEFFIGNIGKNKCVITTCGIGKVNAARSTQMLIDKYHPDSIINIGVAGGISNKLKIGNVVIAEKLVQYDFDLTAFGKETGELPDGIGKNIYCNEKMVNKAKKTLQEISKINAVIGTIASGDRFVTEIEKSKEINRIFNADCVEMEGAAVAQVCFLDKIPFIVIRSISDSINDNNKIDYEIFMKTAAENAALFVNKFLNM